MIEGKTVLAIIPARGGSKGIARKNIRYLGGKPLIAWAIEAAKKSKYIDRLILSSDDVEIIEVAKGFGCDAPFVRPSELAQDDSPGIDPVLHAMDNLSKEYDYVALLQPTSPLRNEDDIDGCLEMCVNANSQSCVSVAETKHNPYWMYHLDKDSILVPLFESGKEYTRRQELPKVYAINGAVYVAEFHWLRAEKKFIGENTLAYIMPEERSVDIDSEADLELLEQLLLRKAERNTVENTTH